MKSGAFTFCTLPILKPKQTPNAKFELMKKLLLHFLLILFPFGALVAQVSYSFTAATGTYSALSGGTSPLLFTPSLNYGPADEGYTNSIPLGFTFVYNGVAYTTVNVNVNGFMTFGEGFNDDDEEDYFLNSLTSGPSSQTNIRPIIAPLWDDLNLVDEANIKYQMSGTAPNRVFTMEWANAHWSYTADDPVISFQVKLYETNNIVEFLYKQEAGNTSGASASIGISGFLSGANNFISLSNSSAAPAASSTAEITTIAIKPATNQVYRFTPLACIAPGITSFSNQTASSITLSWNTVAGVTGYEYATSTSSTPPLSGTFTTATSFNFTGLPQGVNNFFYVRSVCGGGSFSDWARRATVKCTGNLTPANGAVTPWRPDLSWSPVAGATAYTVMLSFDGIGFDNIGTLDSSNMAATISNLAHGTTYYFYVRPVIGSDTAGTSCASNATTFKVQDVPCTQNTAPANGATNISPASTIISWNEVADASEYVVLLSSDGGNTYNIIGSTPNTSADLGGQGILDYNTTYHYYVRAIVGSDTASVNCKSNATSFSSGTVPPVPLNDECSGAIVVGLTPVNATTLGASESMPANSCNEFFGNANDDVWFKFTAVSNGNVSIMLTNSGTGLDAIIEAFSGPCGSLVLLKCADDTVDGENETLNLTNIISGQTYYIRVYGYNDYVDGGIFTIQLSGTALPLLLTNFTGVRLGLTNALKWTTQSEQGAKAFELQRSADGSNYSTIGSVASKAFNGNSSTTLQYEFTDTKPFTGNNYYRLKLLDKDGSFSYSAIVLIKGSKPGGLRLSSPYPNPVNSLLNLVISSLVNEGVNVIVTDLLGRPVMQQSVRINIGDNAIRLNVSALAKGSYLIRAVCANGCETSVEKFVKQ